MWTRPVVRWMVSLVLIIVLCRPGLAADDLPKVLDSRLQIQLFAEQPQLVTPTGIDVDADGRVWVIESNTHFRPEGYSGHPSDRLLILVDENGDGRADEPRVFADGFRHAMSVAVRPGWFPLEPQPGTVASASNPLVVYVATRREIVMLIDENRDLQVDRRETVVRLETPGDYPHNGLAGLVIDPLGWLYFGFGENLGAKYEMIGADGRKLSGGAEGGSLYRCRLDGTLLSRWVTGFWNPHASCLTSFGQLFTVDNDPDSRPPCRLLHIIPGGDYGYRFRNGRKGLHPFTAWNGEIPGTLPMVAGTGEAPSGIVAYEGGQFPLEYAGSLLVGSWGDHRIDRFQLKSKGATFTSLAEPLIVGDENFRPVGLAVAPDGSLYFSDWVLRDYNLHGRGRVWRVSAVQPREILSPALPTAGTTIEWYGRLSSESGQIRRQAAHTLAQSDEGLELLATQVADRGSSARSRTESFWALACQATRKDPPLKLLLILRSLIAARSQTPYVADGRRRAAEAIEVLASWLHGDPDRVPNPVIDNLLRLVVAPASSEVSAPMMLAQRYRELRQPLGENVILPPLPNARSAVTRDVETDSFLQSLLVDRLSQVRDLSQFERWWEAWRNPDLPTRVPGADPFRFAERGLRRPGGNVTREQHILQARLALVLAARRRFPDNQGLLHKFLQDDQLQVRQLAVQWIAEENLTALRPNVEALLQDEKLDSGLLLSVLAGLEMLDGISPVAFDQTPVSKYVWPLVTGDRPPAVRRLALRLVSPADPQLTAELLQSFLASPDPGLQTEAVRTLQLSPLPEAVDLLRGVVENEQLSESARAEALVGLAPAVKTAPAGSPLRELLDPLVLGDRPVLRGEALRALRGIPVDQPLSSVQALSTRLRANMVMVENNQLHELLAQMQFTWGNRQPPFDLASLVPARPADTQGWYRLIGLSLPGQAPFNRREPAPANPPDIDAGRRTFFHTNSAGCAKCHTIEGRGGNVGPDLTHIARTMDRLKLAQSILEPSREMSPQFVAWTFELRTGMVLTGLILSEESEKLKVATSDGQIHDLSLSDIELRTPQTTSLMPDKLIDQLTLQEFIDLLAFLETLK